MEKTFQPSAIETALYQAWEAAGYFHPRMTSTKGALTDQAPCYSIPLPPPNVTGSLHMGHGFQDVLMDVLSRYHRMRGYRVLWQPGVDHAGIATQIVVERQLQQKGQSRHDLGREAFLEKVWEWKETSGDMIAGQMKRLGASCDWSRSHFTMNESQTQATLKTFVTLYREGLIYRGTRLVNWDPVLKTALSDLEVISEEAQGSLWHIRYPVVSTQVSAQGIPSNTTADPNACLAAAGSLIVATTRPETLLGDVAVAVHPEDSRFQHLIGKHLQLPLTDRTIPVIADDTVDPAFGSGCVKITPAHDFNDYAMAKRHGLPMISILTPEASLNDKTPIAYQGLDRFEARKKILGDLESLGFLVKTEPHALKLPKSERTGAIVEPMLSDQWYVNIAPLAKPAIDAVKEGKIQFIPENAENLYFRWMEDIQDWCISRQLWWGHRIPAWYDDAGNIYVGMTEQEARAHHGLPDSVKLRQDEDVFDTWFTSALWPFASLDWPVSTEFLQAFYPHAVLVTGFDIIFFWVARMIMFGLKLMGDVPFKKVYVHGLIRDHEGQKMSKSKGNVLDPIDLIDGIDLERLIQKRTSGLMNPKQAEKIIKDTRKTFPNGIAAYGCDALRFTYTALASTSRDINFSVERLEGYRNFCNKLWNAARFVTMQIEHIGYDPHAQRAFTPVDHWIAVVLNQTIDEIHQQMQEFRFDHLAQTLYSTIWNEFCDWYLELAKVTLQSPTCSGAEKQGALYTLISSLEVLLRLAHPVIPFITEEIWQHLRPYHLRTEAHLMIAPYPTAFSLESSSEDTLLHDHCHPQKDAYLHAQDSSLATIETLKRAITQIRTLRSELNISPAKSITLYCKSKKTLLSESSNTVEHTLPWLLSLTKASALHWIDASESTESLGPCSVTQWDHLECYVPLTGLIDFDAERARLQKEIQKAKLDIEKLHQKLSLPDFKDKAPQAVLEKTLAQKSALESNVAIWERELRQFGG